MKTLEDSLRDELKEILKDEKYNAIIKAKNLDIKLIQNSYEKLLDNMRNGDTEDQLDGGRSQFQNFIVNHLKA
jgi:hypothetical protein